MLASSDTVIEGYAVETAGGLIFTVKGMLHPADRVIAYLRYLPDPAGDRERDGTRFRRVYHFDEQQDLLSQRYPQFMIDDPVLGLTVQSVPHTDIVAVHSPVTYLSRLRSKGPGRPVEEDVLALASLIQGQAGVAWENMGVSGSLMLGTQRSSSDIDLIVYGQTPCRRVYRALGDLLAQDGGSLQRPDRKALRELYHAHRPDTPLSFDQFRRSQGRKVNESRFRGRSIFVRFVPWPAELGESYGERIHSSLGSARLRATVTDDHWAIYTPCRYLLEQVEMLEGNPVEDLHEIISHRGRFADQAREGERCEAQGILEAVQPQGDKPYHRLIVGGQAGDYLRSEYRNNTGERYE